MQRQQLQATVISVLKTIAPEVDEVALAPEQPLRDQVDLDSMDWLNFLIGLHDRLQVEIPQSDYQKLRSLDDLVDYLHKNAGESQ